MATQVPELPPEVYGAFSDQINQASIQRIFNTVGIACNNGVRHIHLLFQSTGGFVADGVALYNFFKTIPLELTIYNVGSVQSMGTIAFLGARHRKASAISSFQIHLVSGPQVAAKAAQLEGIAEGIRVDDARVEAILRKHLNLPNERWAQLNVRDMTFTAEDAVEYGFADEIGEFTPPFGGKVFNV